MKNNFFENVLAIIGIFIYAVSIFSPITTGKVVVDSVRPVTTESKSIVVILENKSNKGLNGSPASANFTKLERITENGNEDVIKKTEPDTSEIAFTARPLIKISVITFIREPLEPGDYVGIIRYEMQVGFLNKSIETKEITVNFTVERA